MGTEYMSNHSQRPSNVMITSDRDVSQFIGSTAANTSIKTNPGITTKPYDVYRKLKNTHLPDLRTLHDDCLWLTSKLELKDKKELQPSETRLLQFVAAVSATIKQITDLRDANDNNGPNSEWGRLVLSIEAKILKTILPVRARLLSRIEDKTKAQNSADSNLLQSSLKDIVSSNAQDALTMVGSKRPRPDDCMDTVSLTTSESSYESSLRSASKSGAATPSPSYQGEDLSHNPSKPSKSNAFTSALQSNAGTIKAQSSQSAGLISSQSSMSNLSGVNVLNVNATMNGSTIYYSSATDPTINGPLQTNVASEEEYVSTRRRRRLNQIVPNPRKPRQADYNCSVCNEPYSCVVQDNPWWAVYHHECPKCHLLQVPRIDIGLQSNAVEHDPNVSALYGEGIDDSGDEGEESECGSDNECNDEGEDDVEGVENNANGEEVGQEDELDDEKPFDGDGLLAQEEASKLLVLMCHARTCSGYHSSPKHAEICRSTKFLMLHIRDCTGRDIHSRECKFPWCLPCKKMLRHLTRCYDPATCAVCNPWSLPESYQQLRALNQIRNMPVA